MNLLYGNLHLKAFISFIFISCFIIYHFNIDKIFNKRKKLNTVNIYIAKYQACKYILKKNKRVEKLVYSFTDEIMPKEIENYLNFIIGVTDRIVNSYNVEELEKILDEFDIKFDNIKNK